MKTTRFFMYSVVVLLIACAPTLTAQPGMMNGQGGGQGFKNHHMGIPNLTDEQQTKIENLRVAHLKEIQPLKNQMAELKAKQRTLTTADKPDMKAIDANIDEITKLQNTIMKKAAAHRQDVRAVLTDEQKLWFDAHAGNWKKGNGFGQRKGMGPGMRHQQRFIQN